MRQLATIQKIKSLETIPEKDKIVLASFEDIGFHCIVQKDEFKVGDLCVYVQVDAVLPEKPEFEFLRKRCWNEKYRGFRIKAMKMGGVFSEGIVFPVSILPKELVRVVNFDVTSYVGAVKYDPEAEEEDTLRVKPKGIKKLLARIPFFKNIFFPKRERGTFPTKYAKITDETRLQAIPWILDDLRGKEVYITTKVDGQSATFILNEKNKLIVASRKLTLKNDTGDNYWEMVKKYDMLNRLRKAKRVLGAKTLVLQGEIAGPGIQKNRLNLKEKQLFLFNLKVDGKDENIFQVGGAGGLVTSILRCERVPLLFTGVLPEMTVDGWVDYSIGFYDEEKTLPREGIVVRPMNPEPGRDKTGPVFGFKVISPQFIQKYEI